VVVVWHVEDTAEALFDVNDYERYVKIQSESAVRHLANTYPYDHGEGNELTLRGTWMKFASRFKKNSRSGSARPACA